MLTGPKVVEFYYSYRNLDDLEAIRKQAGKGFATELAGAVVQDAFAEKIAEKILAAVDVPNVGSIRVLEKLGFTRIGQVYAYESDDMYLYQLRNPASQMGNYPGKR